MRRLCFGLGATLILASIIPMTGYSNTDLPMPQDYVQDHAKVIDYAKASSLNRLLQELERRTGTRYIILTVQTTGGMSIEQFATDMIRKLKLKNVDSKYMLFILAKQDRKYRFEVGRGLGNFITDAYCSRIGREVLVPNLKRGDYSGGIYQANQKIIQKITDIEPDDMLEEEQDIGRFLPHAIKHNEIYVLKLWPESVKHSVKSEVSSNYRINIFFESVGSIYNLNVQLASSNNKYQIEGDGGAILITLPTGLQPDEAKKRVSYLDKLGKPVEGASLPYFREGILEVLKLAAPSVGKYNVADITEKVFAVIGVGKLELINTKGTTFGESNGYEALFVRWDPIYRGGKRIRANALQFSIPLGVSAVTASLLLKDKGIGAFFYINLSCTTAKVGILASAYDNRQSSKLAGVADHPLILRDLFHSSYAADILYPNGELKTVKLQKERIMWLLDNDTAFLAKYIISGGPEYTLMGRQVRRDLYEFFLLYVESQHMEKIAESMPYNRGDNKYVPMPSPSGSTFAFVDNEDARRPDNVVRLYDFKDKSLDNVYASHYITQIFWLDENELFIVEIPEEKLVTRVLNLKTRETRQIENVSRIHDAGYGQLVLTSDEGTFIYNARNGTKLKIADFRPLSVKFSPDGKKLAVHQVKEQKSPGYVHIVELSSLSKRMVLEVEKEKWVHLLEWSKDSTKLYVYVAEDKDLFIIDTQGRRQRFPLR